MKTQKLLLTISFLLISTFSFSQGYWRVGYNVAGSIMPRLRAAIKDFNDLRPDFDKKLEKTGFFYRGIAIGYGLEFPDYNLSMEWMWSNLHDFSEANGYDSIYGKHTDWKFKFRRNCFTYALNFRVPNNPCLILGISLDLDNYRSFKWMKPDDEKYVWMDKNMLVEDKIYLIYELPSDSKFALQIQPYLQLPWPLLWLNYDVFEDYMYQDNLLGNHHTDLPINYGVFITGRLAPNR